MKAKIFLAFKSLDPAEHGLEEQINDWFVANPGIAIAQISQSQSQPADGYPCVCITVFYRET